MITWTSQDKACAISVEFDRYDGDRAQYTYTLSDPMGDREYSASDLRSGSNADVDEIDMLRTLSSFVSAYVESVEYGARTGQHGENADLFPTEWADFLSAYSDEFTLDMMQEED